MRRTYAKKVVTWWSMTALSGYLLFSSAQPDLVKVMHSAATGYLAVKAASYTIALIQEKPKS